MLLKHWDSFWSGLRHGIDLPHAGVSIPIWRSGSSGEKTGKSEICFIAFVCHSLQRAIWGYRCRKQRLLTTVSRVLQSWVFSRKAHGPVMPRNLAQAICPHSASFSVAAIVGGLSLLLRRSKLDARRFLQSSSKPASRVFNPSSQQSPHPSSSCPCRPSSFCGPSCAGSALMSCTHRRNG